MPLLTRWFIKTSLLFFILALSIGLLMALQGLIKVNFPFGALFPVYIHLLALGWISELIFGVVFWMFPKASREKPRGSEGLGWASYGLLNAGLLLRAISEPAVTLRPGSGWGWLLASAALLQWLGGMAFVLNTWGRVKEK
jgi:hypothetical protein